MEIMGSGKLCISGHSQKITRSYRPRKSQVFDVFWPFLTFWVFSKTTLPYRIWDCGFNSQNELWEAHLLMRLRPNVLTFGEVKFLIVWQFFVLSFDFSRTLPSRIWFFGFNRNYRLRESFLHKRLSIIFPNKKVWFSDISSFWLAKLFLDSSR